MNKIDRENQEIQREDIAALHVEIEKYQKFMDKIKENQRLYSIVCRELTVGIRQIRYRVDGITYLKESEKKQITDKLYQYIYQIENTNK
jgi:hypothetical protein